MATLFIVNTFHTAKEAVVPFSRTVTDRQLVVRVSQVYADCMWRHHLQVLKRYGMWARSTTTRYLFSEGHVIGTPPAYVRRGVLRWRRRPNFLRARPQWQVMLHALQLNYQLVPIESSLLRKWAASKKLYGRSKTRDRRARRARDRLAAEIIHKTLSGNQRGILLMGAAHNVKRELQQMHSPIRVVDLYFDVRPRLLF